MAIYFPRHTVPQYEVLMPGETVEAEWLGAELLQLDRAPKSSGNSIKMHVLIPGCWGRA